MRNRRLGRLALLTQGAALVGLGMTQLACRKDATPPAEPVHVNSPPLPPLPPLPPASASAATPPPPVLTANTPPELPPTTSSPLMNTTDAGEGLGIGRPTMNAPPRKLSPAPSAKP